ncbi:uncharacterized protein LOC130934870 [Arachis stenosperma]|uniref:uncharacterized protein LOC130934870 n=1 Tax=Arachis stenosperma TaxID=217475 RepID=UPI0025AD7F91|nr:uncharacterized protein LOC130934870 [Arachis stenosperma]
MAKRASCQGEATSRNTLRWTDEMDTTFIDALIEECHKGNRVDGTFTTMAYDNILSHLRSIYGNHIHKENLKNRLKTLNDHFGVCYDNFHGLSGFSWNSITKMFEAEAEVWKELIKKWMRTPIKHYDKLFEIYGTDRATGKHAESAKEKVKRWEKHKEIINLNDDDSFLNMEEEWNEYPITPYATSFTMGHSPEIGLSNQSTGSQGTSSRAEEQVQVAKEQVQIAKQQVRMAERDLVILEQSKPRIYSENDVWNELENLGVMPELRMRCYHFLCREDRAKRDFFGVPADVRLATLYELMREAGAL